VRVKSREARLERSLLGARTPLLNRVTDLSNQILMKTVPKGAGTVFECAGCSRMRRPWPCCRCWTPVRARAADLDRQLLSRVRENAACRQLMTIPGVGAVVALSFVIETPEAFPRSRDVGAWMTPRRYQSGEVDYEGHISRRGDARLRSLLYEAAMAMLTRVRGESELRSWR
jgi:transposase